MIQAGLTHLDAILDGIWMVGNNMLNVEINNRLKDIMGSREAFGGVSIIAIGDLFQLPPVMDGYVFKNLRNSAYGVLAPKLWHQYFNMCELHETMRQCFTGANSTELRSKTLKQIPEDPKKTKQLISNLHLAEGKRTEKAINVRTEDGMTNGASNINKKIESVEPHR